MRSSVIVFVIALAIGGGLWYSDNRFETAQNLRMTQLEHEVKSLHLLVSALTQRKPETIVQEKPVVKTEEIVRREVIQNNAQGSQLTDAVATVAPSVVSIVITKDVPKLEVVYENPFGNDPMFQDVGIRVPRYIQKGTEAQKVGAGTGFIVSTNGYIVTNRHVVDDTNARYTVLLADGSQKDATVVFLSDTSDLALIKISGTYAAIQWGDSSTLKLGQSVFAVGNALGEYNNSVSVGVVSGLNRDIEATSASGTEKLTGVIQTDAAINPGNSGGPLVDLQGRVIGVNVATVTGSNNVSFSIPINSVKSIIQPQLK